ncbi:putative sigma-54 dependent transcriptional regulator [uncultured Alphaproteobacteria bacterium]|uniref:Putative sigma-54 dependent transcriptional regulator n=1 Tax=uncultured Alphaproteobacteria bacterium TaxID=91750 RepID=A0A212JYZ4_9PROT|nr:putative sigma-54 dependent transcriptional regulator [uncultured Alphaproteobacteria bacterium]
MANEICLIAPYAELAAVAWQVEGVVPRGFDVRTANLEDALALLPEVEAAGYRVLVSRGKTAELLRKHTALPVIAIEIDSYDVLRVLADLIGKPCRIAIVGHAGILRDLTKMADTLGLASYSILFEQADALEYEQLQAAVRARLVRDPVDLMIGDTIPQSRFAPLCPEFRLVSSGPESVAKALESAAALLDAIDLERVNRDHLSTVLDLFEKAVFSLDQGGCVTHANRAATVAFQMTRAEMMGQPIEAVDPALAIAHETLARGTWEVGPVVETRFGRMVCYLYPIVSDGVGRGMVFALERVERIYTVEQKIRRQERQENRFVAQYRLEDYITRDAGMRRRLDQVRRYARTDATILITGESGTGKELLAQGIHRAGRRAEGPFVAVNCGAFPPTLLESELFGYVEGAFTGASRKGKKGVFELAHTGTLFLDEVGELEKSLQTRLLRVIQERELMRLGSEQPIPVDIRVIAASNKCLEEMVAAGAFREDLFYRLNVLKFETVPLRARPDDIVPSALFALRRHAQAYGSPATDLAPDLRRALVAGSWRGNFRQLSNVMERLAILADAAVVTLAAARPALADIDGARPEARPCGGCDLLEGSFGEIRDRVVARVLSLERGSRSRAARRLGVDRTTLARWLKDPAAPRVAE